MTIPEDGTWIEAYPFQEIPTENPREQNILQQALPKALKTSQGDMFADI
jgi:hypothetical protein